MDFLRSTKVYIGMLFAFTAITTGSIWGVQFDNVQNASVSGAFDMNHTVARKSFFSTSVVNSNIDTVGDTKIGRFTVRNNTRDGYRIKVTSANGGVLKAAETDDGEADMAYSLSLIENGDLGTGVTFVNAVSSVSLANSADVYIFDTTSTQTSPTDLKCDVYVNIASSQEDKFLMAGTYSDTITITYEDK